MANSKNTIQNIPLASELCMNALKTEVKQFQGYNEKNTTLYGGTLSPMWDNKKELPFDKDNSYTVFNSKGVPFTLVREGNQICLYKQNISLNRVLTTFKKTEKLFVKNVDDMVIVAKAPDGSVLSVSRNRGFYIDNVLKSELTGSLAPLWIKDDSNAKVVDCQVFFVDDKAVLMITFVGVLSEDAPGEPDYSEDKILSETCIFILDDNKNLHRARWSMFWGGYDWQKVPVFAFTIESDPSIVRVCVTDPLKTKASNGPTVKYPTYRFHQIVRVDIVNYDAGGNGVNTTGHPDEVFYEDIYQPGVAHYLIPQISDDDLKNFRLLYNEMARFAGRYVGGYVKNDYYYGVYRYNGTNRYIPIESKDDITCPLGNYSDPASIYYLDGNLISIGIEGRPIIPCLSFSSNIITPYNQNGVYSITYKSGQDWYCFSYSNLSSSQPSDIIPYLKSLIVDNRFIFFANYVIDIENVEDGWKKCNLDWILADPVLSDDTNLDGSTPVTKGAVYAAGVNAGYTVSNAPLVGYLPNPYIGKVFSLELSTPYNTVDESYIIPNIVDSAQYYWEIGDTSKSATYKGSDPQYYGTTYPIDPNGNVVLPISMNAQIIKGYSNNDMVKEGTTVYPLMYWNNNQKVYAYYLLAGVENVTNVFSLQGQQYAVDDENIYAVAFNGGVVSQVQSVSYKKNLTFLGTLPTQAVFWSDFNKTFYAFTGDRVLSKMFEASDIHKILYVGQNPSSLSLWVCTDTGIYVLSDTDQFRLDYVSKMVGFLPKTTLLLTEGDENNEVHAVSLYLDDGEEGEMVPVKLKTSYYGLGNEMKAVMDCWYLRLFDENNTKGYVKAKVHTITDITRHTEEKTFEVNPSDYDENHIVYLRFQPKYQECVSMQFELETNLGIYQISLGVNTTDSTAQVSKFNF